MMIEMVMTRIPFVCVLILALSCDTVSNIEPPDESFFLKFYGGEGNQEGVDAVVNTDGTITLFGTSDDGGISKLYLVNIDANGQRNWEAKLNADKNTRAKDLELTNDGRLAVVADVENTLTERDILVLTLDPIALAVNPSNAINAIVASDTINFFQSVGGAPTDETGNSISQTSDGFIVAGSTNNLAIKPSGSGPAGTDNRDALHVRYFNDLTVYPNTWRQGNGAGTYDEGIKVVQVSATQFYFFGYSDTPSLDGNLNFHILGLGADGEANGPGDFTTGLSGSSDRLSSVIISPPQSGEGFLLTGVSTNTSAPGLVDIYVAKLRKDLSFTGSDIQIEKSLSPSLGPIAEAKVAAYPLKNSGFLILTNEKQGATQNFRLDRINNSLSSVWSSPVIFGGEKDDRIGTVLELPDGSIGIIGTFGVGEDGETKMTFIKVNREGKFLK